MALTRTSVRTLLLILPTSMKLPILLCCVVGLGVLAQQNPVEIGTVQLGRDLDQALDASKQSGKPVFLLFQEVPGCKGCRDFGKEVLSNVVLVDVIENHFVPVVVYNNRGGEHERIRKAFKEPAWNYQVIRFLNAEGRDLIPRKDRIWSTPALSSRMVEALEKANRPVPESLRRLAPKPSSSRTATAAFAQFCYWTGERKLGALEGVLVTEAGYIDHREVTKVTYDPAVISYAELERKAKQMKCASVSYEHVPGSYKKASRNNQKKQIQGTRFASLDLTPEQATKVNAFARTDPRKALEVLTPDQREALASRKMH